MLPDTTLDGGRATILVVDDTPQNLAILGELMKPWYQVRVANSGERALASLATKPRPDLILLDIMMPGMDGFELMQRLRENEETRDIPVIFVTALNDVNNEHRGFELGAADYIHKPFKSVIVLSRIKAQLEAKAARDMLRRTNQRLTSQVSEGVNALETAQLQLLQSEKMAAMGQLAAGLAHEINNPIGFVGSNLGTLSGYLDDIFSIVDAYERAESQLKESEAFADARGIKERVNFDFLKSDIRALLEESRDGINRVRGIVKDLKDFSRSDDKDWQWVDIHQGLESTLNILRNELKYHCTVVKRYGEVPKVHCLPSQINQVFMNLLANAGQAIEGRGEITITTDQPDPAHVRVTVSDTGKGMPPEVREHIFEPFFTTKPVGKGTGLGLSIAWSIIERHRGRIEVSSEPGKGTAFAITLPVTGEVSGQESVNEHGQA